MLGEFDTPGTQTFTLIFLSVHPCYYYNMKHKSLSQTNPYLKDLKQREACLTTSVITSSAVERITIDLKNKPSEKKQKTTPKMLANVLFDD